MMRNTMPPLTGQRGLAEEIVLLARENGMALDASTELMSVLEQLSSDTDLRAPVILAISELLSPVFRAETHLEAEAAAHLEADDDTMTDGDDTDGAL